MAQWIGNYGLITLFVLFWVLDGIGKFYIFSKDKTNFPLILKAIISALVLCFLFFRPWKKGFLPHIIVLSLIFIIGQLTLQIPFTTKNLILFGKFLTPLLFIELFNVIKPNKKLLPWVFSIFEWVLVLNGIFIWLGFIFDIKLFESYAGSRFGYNGLFVTSGVGSYCAIISLGYFFLRYKASVWKNLKFLVILSSFFLIGTKTVYAGLSLFLAVNLFQSNFSKKKYFPLLILLFFIGGFYLFFFQLGFFAKLTNEKGLMTSFLSLRDELLLNNTIPYISKNWDWVNYLFGGISDYNLRSQMEIFDLFFFWGIIGGGLYLYTLINSYMTFRLTLGLWVFFSFFAVMFFIAGNFFAYATITIFLLLFRELISQCNNPLNPI